MLAYAATEAATPQASHAAGSRKTLRQGKLAPGLLRGKSRQGIGPARTRFASAWPRTAEGTLFAGDEIAGEEDHRRRKIDSAIVAQRQDAFVQHAQEEIPQRVGGFFNLVEKHETNLDRVGVVPVQCPLR